MRFFDASALVKKYVRETDSARVRRLLRSGEVALSRLSEVEVVSAFARLARDEAISVAQRDRAVAAFVGDLMAWHVIELTPDVMATARRLLMQHQLRAGDAVQLSAALVLQVGLGESLEEFVAYDHRILGVAHAEQLAVRIK
jgi:predicted nucleic acid-binding protein